jgi:hypothetical protein
MPGKMAVVGPGSPDLSLTQGKTLREERSGHFHPFSHLFTPGNRLSFKGKRAGSVFTQDDFADDLFDQDF